MAGLRVESRHAPAKRAALIFGISHHNHFFARRDADIDATVVIDWRARSDGHRMRIGLGFPYLRACLRIEREESPANVAEIDNAVCISRAAARGHACFKLPNLLAGLC